tara:strand:+ start:62 stop:280 length:219 start_codon:yes stop_codon:yes gene_type:complete
MARKKHNKSLLLADYIKSAVDKKYPGYRIINETNKEMFSSWDKADPVSLWEIERNKRINEVFGVYNEFVGVP